MPRSLSFRRTEKNTFARVTWSNLCAQVAIDRSFSSNVLRLCFMTLFASYHGSRKNHKHGMPWHYINIGQASRGHSLCRKSNDYFIHSPVLHPTPITQNIHSHVQLRLYAFDAFLHRVFISSLLVIGIMCSKKMTFQINTKVI